MIKDPKQIVTPYAFSVHEDLLGLPLATPKRRLLALLIDLVIASILTALNAFLLAAAVSGVFFWVAVRIKSPVWWKNLLKYGVASTASILVFALSFSLTETDSDFENPTIITSSRDSTGVNRDSTEFDFIALGKALSVLGSNDSTNFEDELEELALSLANELGVDTNENDPTSMNPLFEDQVKPLLAQLSTSIDLNDTLAVDSLRVKLSPIISSIELKENADRVNKLRSRNSDLEDKNDELQDMVDNPTLLRTITATAEDFGLTFGWIGIYFVLTLALFKGTTLGKKILGLKVIRLNNKPIGLWYSFERFGGYAAGIATGLLGFFQIFWDPNRQAIHDKIAGTVVVDLREKKIQKVAHIREEILATKKETDSDE